MITSGGEIEFTTKILKQSVQLKNRINWYTTMLGKLSSVSIIIEKLIQYGINNYAVMEFIQGSKTKRWAIAWSFGDRRPKMVCLSLFFTLAFFFFAYI